MKESSELNLLMTDAQKDFSKFVRVYTERLDARGKPMSADGTSPADALSKYMHGGFLTYVRALECLKTSASSAAADSAAEAMADDFLKLDRAVAAEWKRLGKKPRRSFYRTSLIVRSICKPNAFETKGMPSAFKGSVSPRTFRRMAVDRSCKAIYGILAWLREASCMLERK